MHKVLSAIVLLAAIFLAVSLASAQDIANGQKAYNAKRASCHGPDGKGQTEKRPRFGISVWMK